MLPVTDMDLRPSDEIAGGGVISHPESVPNFSGSLDKVF
jgi:hypothetical protein